MSSILDDIRAWKRSFRNRHAQGKGRRFRNNSITADVFLVFQTMGRLHKPGVSYWKR